MTSAVPGPIEVVDSHTAGEPTRVVIAGWPEPSGDSVAARRESMRAGHDDYRRAVVLEPRGHEAIVGALLVPADRPEAATGVVYFNDVSWLGMCGHGTIGVVRTLHFLGRIEVGPVELDTPVGPVGAVLHDDGSVTIRSVPAYLHQAGVSVDVPGHGRISGDVAWGGNWFFLVDDVGVPLEFGRRLELLDLARAIRSALQANRITGRGGALIDHIELCGPPLDPTADGRNFVLCPGEAYDRSPCGTGTAAKMSVLHAHGRLAIGAEWRQESIIGSRFTGWLEQRGTELIPFIRGTAHITSTATLRFDPEDPLAWGIG